MERLLSVLLLLLCLANGAPVSLPLRHHRNPAALLQFVERSSAVAPLDHMTQPPELWSVQVSIGTPPQTFAAFLDTGSVDLLIQSTSCSSCPGTARFSSSASSTFALLGCGSASCVEQCLANCNLPPKSPTCLFNDSYADHSWIYGDVGTDTITLGGLTVSSKSFGVVSSGVTTFFKSQPTPSGIMGLAYSTVSCWGSESVLSAVLSANPSVNQSFTLCLTPSGGQMVLGEDFAKIPYTWVSYTAGPIASEASAGGHYAVQLFSVTVGSVILTAGFEIVVDSGSTNLNIERTLYEQIINELRSACMGSACRIFSSSSSSAASASLADISQLPNISLNLGALALELGPTQYLTQVDPVNDPSLWAVTFLPSTVQTIGYQWMKYYRIAFDLKNTRLGFAIGDKYCVGDDWTLAPTGAALSHICTALLVILLPVAMYCL